MEQKRKYNLMEHQEELLNRYGLKQGLYVYIGSS